MASVSDCSNVYIAEYSASSRRHCRRCKKAIKTKGLCLGSKVPCHDVVLWYHSSCFFLVNGMVSTDEIGNFCLLRFSDQQLLIRLSSKSKGSSGSRRPPSAFSVAYAESTSTCKVCQKAIQKMELCVLKEDYDVKLKQIREVHHSYHTDCFEHVREILGFSKELKELQGFKKLSQQVQEKLQKSGKRKRSSSPPPEQPVSKRIKVNEDAKLKLQEQSDMLFDIRDKLESSLSQKELVMILQQNNQLVLDDQNVILNLAADCVAFGALKKCPVCKGQLLLSDRGYKCQGHATEWASCIYETVRPARQKFVFPSEYAKKCESLSRYISGFTTRSRIFPPKPAALCSRLKPLYNFKIVVTGFEEEKKKDISRQISYLGGEVVEEISSSVSCVIASEVVGSEYEEAMKSAEENDITVVSESFLSAAKYSQAAYHLAEHSIKPWGIGISDEAKAAKHLDEKQKVRKCVIKGSVDLTVSTDHGAKIPVEQFHLYHTPDSDSGLADKADVVCLGGIQYSCVLAMVDVTRGLNCFYKMQVLRERATNGTRYWLFEAEGQIFCSTVCEKKVTSYLSDRTKAISEFLRLYAEKTGNSLASKMSAKKPNCYYPLKIDNGQDNLDLIKDIAVSSKLSQPVKNLIAMIFDIKHMEAVMLEYEIDTKLMPLGKLAKAQILQAYKVLKGLNEMLESRGKSKKIEIISATNQFYTLIPHDFGVISPPLLDSREVIAEKTKMLDSLMEIQWAYKLISNGAGSDIGNPFDCNYVKLNSNIEPLDTNSPDFHDIQLYFKRTHGYTHNFHLQLLQVYKISRHGEREKYEKECGKMINKKLLWHGSPVTNYVGILSHGLRISPPEIPLTSLMFGRGIYFADMVSKSANYCRVYNSTGLLLLCEVALGNMCEMSTAANSIQLPSYAHSIKGVGRTMPDPSQCIVRGRVEIPCGKPIRSNVQESALLYNEYVIYNENQVNIRYLVMFKMY